ncbi:hypothetical protein ACFW9L_21125 [Streptomyces sp. NPDC059517]|uniref:hypothetical protein n=1 Tax=Streptomyces sp. NPDC059517 TaxID=3346855 RepID=UPI003674EFF4
MPSTSAVPARRPGDAPPDRRMPSTLDRVITGLSWWWSATPLILFAPALARGMGFPQVMAESVDITLWAAALGAVVAPAAGLVAAYSGRRRRALRRFIIMATISSALVLTVWLFLGPLAECPDGYHC